MKINTAKFKNTKTLQLQKHKNGNATKTQNHTLTYSKRRKYTKWIEIHMGENNIESHCLFYRANMIIYWQLHRNQPNRRTSNIMINTKYNTMFVTGEREGHVAGTLSSGFLEALLYFFTWVTGLCVSLYYCFL